MGFVPYGTTWPSLDPYQFSYLGVKFGGIDPTQGYRLAQPGGIVGLGVPKFLSGDVQRPLNNGEFAGYDLAGGRDLIISNIVRADTVTDFESAILALSAIMLPQGNVESPLFFRRGGSTVYAIMCRPRNFTYPLDHIAVQTFATTATMQFHATDWRIYTETQLVNNAFTGTPSSVPVSLGGAVPCNPIFLIQGGAGACQVLIDSDDSSFYLDLTSFTLGTGDQLSIDTDKQTIVAIPASSPPFSAKYALAFSPPAWGPLKVGNTNIEPSNADTGTSWIIDIYFADAFAGV